MMAFAVACFQRLGPLLQAFWMVVDVGLDIRQAIVYRKYAFDKNGTYQHWAINNTDPSTNYTETVSQWYFYTSCIIFFLPPLIITLYFMVSDISSGDASPDNSPPKIVLEKCNIRIKPQGGGSCKSLIWYPFLFFIEYIFICLYCYLFAPIILLVTGFKIALTGGIEHDEEVVSFRPFEVSAKDLPLLVLYGHFFQALPQLILSIVFLSNNYPFLLAYDTIQGTPLPVSLISCIFSGGSVMMGICACVLSLLTCCACCLCAYCLWKVCEDCCC